MKKTIREDMNSSIKTRFKNIIKESNKDAWMTPHLAVLMVLEWKDLLKSLTTLIKSTRLVTLQMSNQMIKWLLLIEMKTCKSQ